MFTLDEKIGSSYVCLCKSQEGVSDLSGRLLARLTLLPKETHPHLRNTIINSHLVLTALTGSCTTL